MKVIPVIKIDKRNTATLRKLTMASCQQIVTSLLFYQFIANLELSESRIPDAWSVKLIFSLKETFYLTKTENRIKKSAIQLSYYCFQ